MGDRNAGRGRHRRERRDAWDDLDRDAGLLQRQRLLAAAAEHERVASLEPDDVKRRPSRADDQLH